MKLSPPIYIPTWPIAVFPELLNTTMSPGCKSLLDTATPSFICPLDDLLSDTPKFLYTYDVNPEQSNPVDGDVPPYVYFVPINCFAYATTFAPFVELVVVWFDVLVFVVCADCVFVVSDLVVSVLFAVFSCF